MRVTQKEMVRKVFITIFVLMLASCAKNQNSISILETSLPTQPENFSSTIEKPVTKFTNAPTSTSTPQATRTPTATNTPELTPTITSTPLPWAKTVISNENANQLINLSSWGRGNVIRYEAVTNQHILALSTLGVFLYKQQGFQLLASYQNAINYQISPDQETAVLVFPDSDLKLIDLNNGEVRHELIYQPKINPELVCMDCDSLIIEKYQTWYYLRAALAFSADNQMLAFGAADGAIIVWNLLDGSQIARLYHDSAGMDEQILFTNDSKNLVSIGRQPLIYTRFGSLSFWSLEQEKMIWYQKADGRLSSQLFSPDNSVVGNFLRPAGSDEDVVRLYSAKEGNFIGQINGQLSSNPWSSDSKLFVSFHSNNVLIWQIQPTFQLVRTIYPKVSVESAIFSDDGSNIIINGGELVYDISNFLEVEAGEAHLPEHVKPFSIAEEQFFAAGHVGHPNGMVITPQNDILLWGGYDKVWRWEPLTGDIQWVSFEKEPMALPSISSAGDNFAACFDSGLEIKGISNQHDVRFDRCIPNGVVAFSPLGNVLAKAISNHIRTINLSDGSTVQDFIGPGYAITWLEYSTDGVFLASGGEVCDMGCKGDLHLWNTSKAQGVTLEEDGSEWPVSDVVFSSDSSQMIAAKNYVWIWDTKNGRLNGRFTNPGSVLALSPDDQLLAVGDYSGIIRFYSLSDRKEITSFQAHQTSINAIAFMPDGANIISAAADGSVKLWGIP